MNHLTSSDRPDLTLLPASGEHTSAAAAAAVDGRIAGVRFRRTLVGRRVMRLRIAAGEGVAVRVRLTRAGRELISRSVDGLAPGSRTVDVRLPGGLAGGRATLTLTFTDAAGGTKTTMAAVTLPEPRA